MNGRENSNFHSTLLDVNYNYTIDMFLDGALFRSERPLNEVIELDLGLEIAKRN